MNKGHVSILLAVALIPMMCYSQSKRPSYVPADGFVPNSATAIAIAEAVWKPIYGQHNLSHKKPFRATLTGNIWIVQGSLPSGYAGGVPIAEIAKKDGRILRVIHSK